MTFIKPPSKELPYNNSISGLQSENTQDAIDELDGYLSSPSSSALSRIHFARFTRSSIVTGSTPVSPGDGHLYAGVSGQSSVTSPLRSGNGNLGLNNPDVLCPYIVPFDGTIIKATATISQTGVTAGAPVYPVICKFDLEDINFNGRSFIAPINFSIDNTHPVGTFWSLADTNFKGEMTLNIPVTKGQELALLFHANTSSATETVTGSMLFITLTIEES